MRDFIAFLRGRLFILNCRYLKRNIQIGKGLRIYKKLSLTGNGKISIGENCIIDGINGDPSQYVCIDTLRTDSVICIGKNAGLYAARISARFQVLIGDDVLIQEAGIMDTDFHSIDRSRSTPADENNDKCQIEIGNRVCICARSFITKGVSIGDDVIIVPGSIVSTSVKSGCTVAGNPAKPIADDQKPGSKTFLKASS